MKRKGNRSCREMEEERKNREKAFSQRRKTIEMKVSIIAIEKRGDDTGGNRKVPPVRVW